MARWVRISAAVEHKLAYVDGGIAGWSDVFVRAIL